jgi:hypothetical protein
MSLEVDCPCARDVEDGSRLNLLTPSMPSVTRTVPALSIASTLWAVMTSPCMQLPLEGGVRRRGCWQVVGGLEGENARCSSFQFMQKLGATFAPMLLGPPVAKLVAAARWCCISYEEVSMVFITVVAGVSAGVLCCCNLGGKGAQGMWGR